MDPWKPQWCFQIGFCVRELLLHPALGHLQISIRWKRLIPCLHHARYRLRIQQDFHHQPKRMLPFSPNEAAILEGVADYSPEEAVWNPVLFPVTGDHTNLCVEDFLSEVRLLYVEFNPDHLRIWQKLCAQSVG